MTANRLPEILTNLQRAEGRITDAAEDLRAWGADMLSDASILWAALTRTREALARLHASGLISDEAAAEINAALEGEP